MKKKWRFCFQSSLKLSILILYLTFNSSCDLRQQETTSVRNEYPNTLQKDTVTPTLTYTINEPTPAEISSLLDNLRAEQAKQFELREVKQVDGRTWESVTSSNGDYVAFHLCEPKCKIFVRNVVSSKIYQLYLPTFKENRDFLELNWSDTYILKFKQSTSPRISLLYTIDIEHEEALSIELLSYPPDN